MTFALRRTTSADIPVLHRLMRDFAGYERLEHRFTITETELQAALFGARPAIESILVEADAAPVGFAFWYLTFGTFSGRYGLFVEDIYVEPAHRGRGIGLALFRHMARVALERQCIDMTWRVLTWNQLAIDFYRRLGARQLTDWHTMELRGAALAELGAANG